MKNYDMRRLWRSLQVFGVNTTTDNTTGNNLAPEMQTFYDKTLIDMAEPLLIHDQWAQKRPIPQNGGKTIQFRKFSPLAKALTPLTEGQAPAGSALDVSDVQATVAQYGDFVAVSDLLDMTAVDPIITETGELLGNQAGRTLDSVTRNVLVAGTNVSYASKVSSGSLVPVTARSAIDATAVLTVRDVKLAVNKLKRQNAPTVEGGYYIGIVHPDVAFDLKEDEEWIEAAKYGEPERLFNGEIGRIAGVRFIETTEAKVFTGAGASSTNVYATLILGKNAYGTTEINGGGLEMIVKPRGAGDDPLNQKQTVGWKATKVAEILVQQYIVRIESSASLQSSVTAN